MPDWNLAGSGDISACHGLAALCDSVQAAAVAAAASRAPSTAAVGSSFLDVVQTSGGDESLAQLAPLARWRSQHRRTKAGYLCAAAGVQNRIAFTGCTILPTPDNTDSGREWCYLEPQVLAGLPRGVRPWGYCAKEVDYDQLSRPSLRRPTSKFHGRLSYRPCLGKPRRSIRQPSPRPQPAQLAQPLEPRRRPCRSRALRSEARACRRRDPEVQRLPHCLTALWARVWRLSLSDVGRHATEG